MPTITRTMFFTDQAVRDLPLSDSARGYIVADNKLPALRLRVGRKLKSYHVESEQRIGGKRVSVYKHLGAAPPTKAAAARRAAETLIGKKAAGDIEPGKRRAMSLDFAMTDYIKSLRAKADATGGDGRWAAEVERLYERTMKDKWGTRSLASLSDAPGEVVEWHKDMTWKAGATSANHAGKILRAAYRHAQRLSRHLPALHPATGIRWNAERRADKAIPFDQLASWAAQVDSLAVNSPLRAAYHRYCLLSGMRPGEAARLRWDGVDCKARTVTIERSKGGRDVVIPMGASIARALKLARDSAADMFDESEWVFPAHSESGHLAQWREDEETLAHWGNSARHTYRTIAASIGINELDIRLLMGHALTDVSGGYITRALLVGTSLRAAQRRISKQLEFLMRISNK